MLIDYLRYIVVGRTCGGTKSNRGFCRRIIFAFRFWRGHGKPMPIPPDRVDKLDLNSWGKT